MIGIYFFQEKSRNVNVIAGLLFGVAISSWTKNNVKPVRNRAFSAAEVFPFEVNRARDRWVANSSAPRDERVVFLLSEVDLPRLGCSIHALSEG
jgi:hypothetical protein